MVTNVFASSDFLFCRYFAHFGLSHAPFESTSTRGLIVFLKL